MELTKEKLIEMGNEWLKMQFITREDHFYKLFSEMHIHDYITLALLGQNCGFYEEGKRLYLADLCDEMDLPMEQVSKIIQRMQNNGVIYWDHDSEERPGTFIVMSELGREKMDLQQAKIEDFFTTAIHEFSKEDFVQLLELRLRFNSVMDSVLHEMK